MNLKPIISSLKIGQKIWAIVEEIMIDQQIIVNFYGDLIRVQNNSSKRLQPGQRIQLTVTSRHPLQFQFTEYSIRPRKLDLEI